MTNTYVKKRRFFPDPRWTMEDGLLTFGDDLSVDVLLEAYSFGIFPWPHDGLPVLWFSPPQRGVLDFKDVHFSKSFYKFLRKNTWKVTYNQAFEKVIEACAQVPRKGQSGTWITPLMKEAYIDFHKAGYAHSIECWEGEKLVGGLYGVYVGGVFSGESMFFKKTNASKVCLFFLIEKLKETGHTWMDIQMVTPLTESIGGRYIPREEFLKRLQEAHAHPSPSFLGTP